MSLTALLLPMAIAVCATTVETVGAIADKYRKSKENQTDMEGIETRFNDSALLIQTLEEHGSETVVCSENRIVAVCSEGELEYRRENEQQPFMLYIRGVKDLEGLVCDINFLEQEYDMNVQAYTYRKVLSNLGDTMRLDSETVLEDDSIVLTISLDE